MKIGRFNAGVECGQRWWRIHSWSLRRWDYKTRKYIYKFDMFRKLRFNGFVIGFAIGPLMFWKEDK